MFQRRQQNYHANEAGSWQQVLLEGFLNGIREAFERLQQELYVAQTERDSYRAQFDVQARELDDLRRSVGIIPNRRETDSHTRNDEERKLLNSPISSASTEFFSEDEYREGNRDHVREDDHFHKDDIARRLVTNNSAGSTPPAAFPVSLKSSNVVITKEEPGREWCAEFNSNVKKVLNVNPVYTFKHVKWIHGMAFSPDGRSLATICDDGAARIYDTKMSDRFCRDKEMVLRAVCFCPDGRYLATAADDRRIRIWQIGKKHLRNAFRGHRSFINSIHFSPDGQVVVSGSDDKTVRVWNMRTGTSKILRGSKASIFSVQLSPCGRYIAAGNQDKILVWDVRGVWLKCLKIDSHYYNSVTFTPDGKGLVNGSGTGLLKLWDFASLARQRPSWGQHDETMDDGDRNKDLRFLLDFVNAGFVHSVAVSHDSQWVISGSYDQKARIWNATNAELQCTLTGHQGPVRSVHFSPVDNYLATGAQDGQVTLWTYGVTR